MARFQAWKTAVLAALLVCGCASNPPKVAVAAVAVRMPDGVSLAVDVMVPQLEAGARVPAVLIQTRYWRSFGLRVGMPPGIPPPGPREDIVPALLEAGYAVVVADVRGTGGSEGQWPHPWSRAEVEDMRSLMDFMVAQPWSNGVVGTYGLSYEGTTALLAATLHHPALKAVLVRQVEWDLVDELLAPGGVRNVAFPAAWGASVAALDRNQYPALFPAMFKWLVTGVRPLDGKDGEAKLEALVARRKVAQVERDVANVRTPADPFGQGGPPAGEVGPLGHVAALQGTQAAVGMWGSWWDGATADAVLRATAGMPVREAVVGAWDHEGNRNNSAFSKDRKDGVVALADVVAFFDRHLKGRGPARASHRWFNAGAERWEEGTAWPVPVPQAWFLAAAGVLARETAELPPSALEVDFLATQGSTSRWMAGMLVPVDYPKRDTLRGAMVWTSAPLAQGVSMFGAPMLHCQVDLTGKEAALHVSLDAITPSGTRYLTEGIQRVTGGPVELRLRPLAVVLPAGTRVRVAVAGADAGNFERVPSQGPVRLTLAGSAGRPCTLELPTRP